MIGGQNTQSNFGGASSYAMNNLKPPAQSFAAGGKR
jgi:hypothetical protein